MCMEDAKEPDAGVYLRSRAKRLQALCKQLQLDAILLITGWDACFNLGSRSLVEWLLGGSAAVPAVADTTPEQARELADLLLEEGVFIISPTDIWWAAVGTDDEVKLTGSTGSGSNTASNLGHAQAGKRQLSNSQSAAQMISKSARGSPNPGTAPSSSLAADPMTISPNCSTDLDDTALTTSAVTGQPNSNGNACSGAAWLWPEPMHAPEVADGLDDKMRLLLQLRPVLQRVGIPLGVEVLHGQQHPVKPSSICRWPLLVALAEVAGTMPEQLFKEVVDVSPSLRELYGAADGTSVGAVLLQRRPLLHRAWMETISGCWRRSSGPKLDLTEAAVATPLTEFTSGCACRLKPGQYQPLALPPRVLFGVRTSCQEALSSGNVSMRGLSRQQGHAVLHATIEAADACSPLRVARTMFFSQGCNISTRQQQLEVPVTSCSSVDPGGCSMSAPALEPGAAAAVGIVADGAEPASDGLLPAAAQVFDLEVDQQDLLDLMAWYGGIVDAAWQTMNHYATQEGATWESAVAVASSVLKAAVAAAGLPAPVVAEIASSSPGKGGATQTVEGGSLSRVPGNAPGYAMGLQEQPVAAVRHSSNSQNSAATAAAVDPPPQLLVQMFSWDGGPRPMPVMHGLQQYNMRYKTIRLTCSGIRSRSSMHPGALLGSVLYMDTFVDVPAVGSAPAQLLNLTLTHCPTNSFNFWGSEAAINAQMVASFRRHLQLQLHMQAQAQLLQAQLAAVQQQQQQHQPGRRLLEDQAEQNTSSPLGSNNKPMHQQLLLLLQQQQQQPQQAGRKHKARRSSLPQLQQLGAQQQHTTLASAASAGYDNVQRQSLDVGRRQQQQKNSKQAAGGSTPNNCCCSTVPAAAIAASPERSDIGLEAMAAGQQQQQQQPSKVSCCPQQMHSAPLPSMLPATPPPGASSPAAAWHLPPAASPTPERMDTLTGACIAGTVGGASAAAGVAENTSTQLQQLGPLLVPPGEMPGEIGLVFTGAQKLCVLDGPLYPHANGLVFVSRPTKVHVLLLHQVAAVWLQNLASQLPGHPAVGPCVVLRGRLPACGLLPALHMTDNPHILIPLQAMSKACRDHWVSVVLPAWQSSGLVGAPQGPAAPWPVPKALQPPFLYWLKGSKKRYMVLQPDEAMDALLRLLDGVGC